MRYHAIGVVKGSLLVVVVYVDLSEEGDARIHIISARKAAAFEVSIYADQFND